MVEIHLLHDAYSISRVAIDVSLVALPNHRLDLLREHRARPLPSLLYIMRHKKQARSSIIYLLGTLDLANSRGGTKIVMKLCVLFVGM